jgi:hypothetical protein
MVADDGDKLNLEAGEFLPHEMSPAAIAAAHVAAG